MQKKAVKDNAKKSKILSAAATCFMADGFEGTSIRKIMNEAGAEVGLFYYYFKSKQDIYAESDAAADDKEYPEPHAHGFREHLKLCL